MKKICIISGTRAEFGLLKNLIEKLYSSSNFETFFLVTGSHLSRRHGYTIDEIYKSKIKITNIIDLNINDDSQLSIINYISTGIIEFGKEFERIKPDLIVVLGDRYEIISAVIPACILNIPIAHIHGGEVTEGAIDDALRHSITKFSHLHFVSNEIYRKRVIQLGESPKNVFNVGAIALDAINNLKLIPKKKIEEELKISFKQKNLIVTYHPETINQKNDTNKIKNMLDAFDLFKDINFIFTLPNSDSGSNNISDLIKKYAKYKKNCIVFPSLGQRNYFSILKYVDGVIGNSSSGILEVPYFKKGTINIGDRQKGRIFSETVINCMLEKDSICEAINKLYSKDFQSKILNANYPYGDIGATEKILNILNQIDFSNLIKKQFHDV